MWVLQRIQETYDKDSCDTVVSLEMSKPASSGSTSLGQAVVPAAKVCRERENSMDPKPC